MNLVISVINLSGEKILTKICERLDIPIVLSTLGRGTANEKMLEVWGLESNEKRVFITVQSEEKTQALILEQKKRLYIDAPGNGVCISVPLKSVGGIGTLTLISGEKKDMKKPKIDFNHELIVVIANAGFTDSVMDLARSAGAGGGTVIHAKGTGGFGTQTFLGVSIAEEKEVVIIVADVNKKGAIMKNIIENAGAGTEVGAIAFSLPVSSIEGFGLKSNEDD